MSHYDSDHTLVTAGCTRVSSRLLSDILDPAVSHSLSVHCMHTCACALHATSGVWERDSVASASSRSIDYGRSVDYGRSDARTRAIIFFLVWLGGGGGGEREGHVPPVPPRFLRLCYSPLFIPISAWCKGKVGTVIDNTPNMLD